MTTLIKVCPWHQQTSRLHRCPHTLERSQRFLTAQIRRWVQSVSAIHPTKRVAAHTRGDTWTVQHTDLWTVCKWTQSKSNRPIPKCSGQYFHVRVRHVFYLLRTLPFICPQPGFCLLSFHSDVVSSSLPALFKRHRWHQRWAGKDEFSKSRCKNGN